MVQVVVAVMIVIFAVIAAKAATVMGQRLLPLPPEASTTLLQATTMRLQGQCRVATRTRRLTAACLLLRRPWQMRVACT